MTLRVRKELELFRRDQGTSTMLVETFEGSGADRFVWLKLLTEDASEHRYHSAIMDSDEVQALVDKLQGWLDREDVKKCRSA
jgi:hypothetical protein